MTVTVRPRPLWAGTVANHVSHRAWSRDFRAGRGGDGIRNMMAAGDMRAQSVMHDDQDE